MTLLLADFCKLRVSASETRKPGKPFSRAYLPEPHPVKSNLRGEERRSPAVPPGQFAVLPSHLRFAPVRCPSGTVRSASISPPLRSGSMDGVRRMGICIKICRGMRASPCIFLCRFPYGERRPSNRSEAEVRWKHCGLSRRDIEPERSGGEMEALRTVPEEQRATAAPRPEGYFSRGGVPEGTLWKKASPACGFRMQKL